MLLLPRLYSLGLLSVRAPRAIASTVAVFALKVAGAAAAFSLNIIVTRSLGPTQSGYYFVALSMVTILYAVARVGLGYSAYRFTSELAATRPAALISMASTAVAIVSISSTVVLLAAILLSPTVAAEFFGDPQLSFLLVLMACTIPLYCTGSILSEILKGLRKPIQYSLFENIIIKYVALPAVTFAAAWWGLTGVAGAYLLANLLGLIFVTVLAVRALAPFRSLAAQPFRRRALLESSGYFAVVSITPVMTQWLGPIVVAHTMTPADAAIFYAAFRTSAVLDLAVISILAVAGPALVESFAQGQYQSLLTLARSTSAQAFIAVMVLSLPLIIWAPQIMSLFGHDFRSGANTLRILAAFQWLHAPLSVVIAATIATRQERFMAITTPLSAVLCFSLTYFFTLYFSIEGAAIGLGLSLALYNLMLLARLLKDASNGNVRAR